MVHRTGRVAGPVLPEGSVWALAFGGLLVCAAFATQTRTGLADPVRAAPALAVVVASAAAGSAYRAVGVGLMGWAFCDGFVVDRYGELLWHGTTDAWRLAAFVAIALAAGRLGRIIRSRGDGRGPDG